MDEIGKYGKVNPFKVRPLIEWEQCITYTELSSTLDALLPIEKAISWFHPVAKFKARFSLQLIDELLCWIEEGKFYIKEKSNEKIN